MSCKIFEAGVHPAGELALRIEVDLQVLCSLIVDCGRRYPIVIDFATHDLFLGCITMRRFRQAGVARCYSPCAGRPRLLPTIWDAGGTHGNRAGYAGVITRQRSAQQQTKIAYAHA